MTPMHRLFAVMIVEGRMQASGCECYRRHSGPRIQNRRERIRSHCDACCNSFKQQTRDRSRSRGKDSVVRLNGRVDVDSSPDLRDQLRTLLSDKALPQTIIVDLTGVSYIETSGVATLIEGLRIARHHQTNFRLQGLSGAVLRLFQVTGVLALFEVKDSAQIGSDQKVS
jgi:anti-sigma B factor antagonist